MKDKDYLLSEGCMAELWALEGNPFEQEQMVIEYEEAAEEQGVLKKWRRLWKQYKKQRAEEKPLPSVSKDYLMSAECMEELAELSIDPVEQQQKIAEYEAAAKEYKILTPWRNLCKEYSKRIKQQAHTVDVGSSLTEFKGQPITLDCGRWKANEYGIITHDGFGAECVACVHPILPVERLENVDTGKVKIKLAFRLGSRWDTVIADKKTISGSGAILELANRGIAVNSENAKYLIQYLHDIEYRNYSIIPTTKSVNRLGWVQGYGFVPYVDSLTFDGDSDYQVFYDSVCEHGNYGVWLDMIKGIRAGKQIAPRVLLAAAFASVLVEPLGRLPFFVHLWSASASGVGKTVALMMAASVWANPVNGCFIHNFTDTKVGMEKNAVFVNSLPLCINELQTRTGSGDRFDDIIYMLCEGLGKTRGNQKGTMDKAGSWRNCILTNGERPISSANSADGALNRVIEIRCDSGIPLFDNAPAVVDCVRSNYGFAGKQFINALDIAAARRINEEYYSILMDTDTTEKQAMAMALILTGDKLATDYIFKDGQALTVDNILPLLKTKSEVSSGERGAADLKNWILQNQAKFNPVSNEYYGRVILNEETQEVYLLRSALKKFCDDYGYNLNSLVAYMAGKGYIGSKDRKGLGKTKKVDGRTEYGYSILIDDNMRAIFENAPWLAE